MSSTVASPPGPGSPTSAAGPGTGTGPGGPGPLSEPLDLVQLCLDEVVVIKLRGDRELQGRLHAYDSHCNVVLADVEERVYVVDEESEDVKIVKNNIELLFVRGDSVVLIAPAVSDKS